MEFQIFSLIKIFFFCVFGFMFILSILPLLFPNESRANKIKDKLNKK